MSTPKTPMDDRINHTLITTRKLELYEAWKARNGIKGTVEEANAFYSGYSEGYVVRCEEDADRERLMKEELQPTPDYKANHESAGRLIASLIEERAELVACVLEMAKQLDRVRMECSACLTFERLARVADEAASLGLQSHADLIKKLKAEKDAV